MRWKQFAASPLVIAIGIVFQLPSIFNIVRVWADWLGDMKVVLFGIVLMTVHITSVAWNHGNPYRAWFRKMTGKTAKLREEVDDTYRKVNRVVNPGILNPEHPGNAEYMHNLAVDAINLLRVELERAGNSPPERCDGSHESLAGWCGYLRRLREKLR